MAEREWAAAGIRCLHCLIGCSKKLLYEGATHRSELVAGNSLQNLTLHSQMKVSNPSLEALQKIITGDSLSNGDPIAPYRSGPDLVKFFNQFGAEDTYGQGFPSRWRYVQSHLEKRNGTADLKEICEAALDQRHFWGSDFDCEKAVDHLNKFLDYDGYRLEQVGKQYQVIETQGDSIEVGGLIREDGGVNESFIQKQVQKCDRKLSEGDFTGAITNARSLTEAVLREVEGALDSDPPSFDGDLSSLYTRVYRKMNLDPSQQGLSRSAREILSGLISAISGLAPLRNAASDSHAPEYQPRKHHAELAVNCAKTVVRFVRDSFEYQVQNGYIDSMSD